MGGMLIIGLTGTFGSGKSTVASMLAECGAAVIDADAIAHQVVEPGSPALGEIRNAFGEEYILPDGRLDRKRMAALVFPSKAHRRTLETIIHPRVREAMDRQIRQFEESHEKTGAPEVIVLNIPLLFESGLATMACKTVVVVIDEGERFHRVRRRDGMSERQVVERLASQWPQRQKAAMADQIVDNSGSLQQTREIVINLYNQWLEDEKKEYFPQAMMQ